MRDVMVPVPGPNSTIVKGREKSTGSTISFASPRELGKTVPTERGERKNCENSRSVELGNLLPRSVRERESLCKISGTTVCYPFLARLQLRRRSFFAWAILPYKQKYSA